jgi:hypothetical protein
MKPPSIFEQACATILARVLLSRVLQTAAQTLLSGGTVVRFEVRPLPDQGGWGSKRARGKRPTRWAYLASEPSGRDGMKLDEIGAEGLDPFLDTLSRQLGE